MTVWRPPSAGWRAQSKPLLDLTAQEPRPVALVDQDDDWRERRRRDAEESAAEKAERAGAHAALMRERELRLNVLAEANALKAQAAAVQEAHRLQLAEIRSRLNAALEAEREKRRAFEAEVRVLRQRVETAEAEARRLQRFVQIAREVLHPSAVEGIDKLAKRRPRPRPDRGSPKPDLPAGAAQAHSVVGTTTPQRSSVIGPDATLDGGST